MADLSHTNAGVCAHLHACSSDEIKDLQARYRKVINWCIREALDPTTYAPSKNPKTPKRPLPKCHHCHIASPRPSVCLQCDIISCRKSIVIKRPIRSPDSARGTSRAPPGAAASSSSDKGKGKARKVVVDHPGAHARASGHMFSVDGLTGAIYCHQCEDFVYAEIIDTWRNRALRTMEERSDISVDEHGKRVKFKVWKPTPEEKAVLNRSTPVRCHSIRPLLNLSQTCFLSAILQAFFHNPLLKQYFLSESHSRRGCEARRAGKAREDGVALGGVGECMGCEMDTAFIEAYTGEGTPFGPTALLLSMWKASSELAGHEQQDAHAFFLAALNQLHVHSGNDDTKHVHCPCIAHRAFAGTLLSTVTCASCGAQTHTEDPILDISLSLQSSHAGPLTLGECFRRYTAEETLSDKAYTCARCRAVSSGTSATKQLSFKQLPKTLAIQLKRFEQNSSNLAKVETMVTFPTELDMRPYMHDAINGQEDQLPREMYRYQLSTVVTHEGKLDNGHYWANVRSGCEWFQCDDEKVTSTSLAQVLNQKAYMLFYVKTSIAYGSGQV
ncbi:hypothetical protein NliqN6_1254 [Naganishia liquefaciens]|uniref:USP domain-containing protein n=1 Tax=Naganishia liquefaciens TaxID=104408 RepID=A0A8H3YE31_9TREE|nr:hypothetical protein NliqN6_1254 [Naganishia liquefaciens]